MYVIKKNNNDILGIFDNITISIEYLNDYINKSIEFLVTYNGDISKFKTDVFKYTIEYYRNNYLQYKYHI